MNEAERRASLAGVGYNLFRLAPDRVRFDMFSDVPHDVLVPESARGAPHADVDELAAAAAPLTGDAHLAFCTKGRAAEIALVEALELDGPPVVLNHGLFSTTQAALARRGAVLEDLPLAAADGSAEVDLDHLAKRLARGGAHIVYLEVANNALCGWPLGEENAAAVRDLCDRHGALFIIDAARPLANAVALGAGDPVAAARRVLALAHAFTISCAKEFLVPLGSVVGAPDPALIGRAVQIAFKSGTSMSPIDPPRHRADLRDGLRYTLAHPSIVGERLARVRELADLLEERGVPVVRPVTAHAVYVPVDRALLPPGDVAAMVSLLAHLYALSGVRAQLANTRRGPAIRFAMTLRQELRSAELAELAEGVADFWGRVGERPALKVADGQAHAHPYFRRLVPA